ncbi:MAG TPA: thioredoxin family protein, partial [Tichowtungia sp.]|nr:thioredoxin family protein [Tichowtungia sp.]
ADFPRSKPQPEDIQKQNKALSQKYGVRGFPTVLLLNAGGEVLGRTGYQRGGPEAYVKHLKDLLK